MTEKQSQPHPSDSFDPTTATTAWTSVQAVELARAWADGRRSWTNLGPHEPYTPDVIAAMDAQEVVKWAALAQAMRTITDEMIERAAKELWEGLEGGDDAWEDVMARPLWHERYLPLAHAALSAALGTGGES